MCGAGAEAAAEIGIGGVARRALRAAEEGEGGIEIVTEIGTGRGGEAGTGMEETKAEPEAEEDPNLQGQ